MRPLVVENFCARQRRGASASHSGSERWNACAAARRGGRMRTPAADCTIWERLKIVSWVSSSSFLRIFHCNGRARALKRSFFHGARNADLPNLNCWSRWSRLHVPERPKGPRRATHSPRPAPRFYLSRCHGRHPSGRDCSRAICISTVRWNRDLHLCVGANVAREGMADAAVLGPHAASCRTGGTDRLLPGCKPAAPSRRPRRADRRSVGPSRPIPEAAWIHSTVANLQCIQCSSSTSRRRADLRPVCGRLTTDRRRRNVRIQPSNRAHASPRVHRVHILTAAFVSRSRTATAPV
jgi:hypothetical protein